MGDGRIFGLLFVVTLFSLLLWAAIDGIKTGSVAQVDWVHGGERLRREDKPYQYWATIVLYFVVDLVILYQAFIHLLPGS